MDKIIVILLILFLVGLIPVWRVAGSKEGYSAWQAINMVAFGNAHKHIPSEEAVEQASSSYRIASSGI